MAEECVLTPLPVYACDFEAPQRVRAAAEKHGSTVRVVFEESLWAFVQQDELPAIRKPLILSHSVVTGA